ncbi:NADH-quinone oxidoreductase subunit L [Anaeromyxobacter oryzae]|uniref:NADH-quinone oxidoreductase subunit L n=1 Tax=Anaeromyxobacter oryzae TaxID=2918170 RepID=A0ABN6MTR2_9BACT|nr:NADH-quinone oxidoreductase subunit L [Anaeromyxobacter oryzae]BDG03045.1 NADH-quinone oxidoreductase subunit L [Anaeromyxobacter oryzae]
MPSIEASTAAAESYLWAIILLPLAGALINGLVGRRIGKANVTLLAIAVMVGAFSISCVEFYHVLHGNTLHFHGFPWIQVAGPDGRAMVTIPWGLTVDQLSGTLLLVVTGVGTLIHIYSASYMSHEDEAGYARFFTYLNLFVAAMLTLVLGDSLILTFVGWEGVGLCSYLLIGFWYTDPQKAFAGRKAFVTNRIGDFGFLIGVFSLFSIFGTASYGQIQQLAEGLRSPATTLITNGVFAGHSYQAAITFALLGLFVGACGKSAQLPLYVWLPDAMAGPTPVSALIHAATMVTAGVYLVARNAFLFSLAPAAMATVTMVGAATALFAALIAFVQNDIKKVLAYSTVSQLGFMFIGVGSGLWWAGILHLVTHAFFKACLFLGAGSVMHGMGDETDVQKMGGLARKMPWTALTFGISTLAITGFVPLSGFFSKDAILAGVHGSHNPVAPWVGTAAYTLGSLAALGTAFYMSRLFFLTFTGKPRTHAAEHAHESSPIMTVPLMVLALLAIVALWLGLPGIEPFAKFTEPVFAAGTERLQAVGHLPHEGHEGMGPFVIAWIIAAAGTFVAWLMYSGPLSAAPARLARAFPATYRFAVDKFRVDELYQFLVIEPTRFAAYILWRIVDVFAIDGLLVNGVARAIGFISSVFRLAQNGDVQRYAAIMAVAAAVILWSVLGVGGH